MMKTLPTVMLCFAAITGFAQSDAKKTFIITSSSTSPALYNHVSSIDINGSKQLKDIYDVKKRYAYRNNCLRPYEKKTNNGGDDTQLPMGGSVACMAFDAKNDRLYYIPQTLSELRYIDLKQPEPSFTCFESQSLNLLHNREDVANQVTRMTIGADGFGYALTNDGEHLIKFSTKETPVIQDLGVLIDNPNNAVLVRSSCTSWGGDIVAAADGNLYLVTVRNHVFKISLPSKKADYIGMIKNLPQEFTSNGASVDEDGNLVVSCGSTLGKSFSPLYKVKWEGLEATPVGQKIEGLGNISDMASSNLLFQQKEKDKKAENERNISFSQAVETDDNKLPVIAIFPNPLRTNGRFQVKTTNMKDKGDYKMIMVDVNGKAIMEAKMNINSSKTTTHSFNFPAQQAKGVYFIQIADVFNRTVYSQQLIVE
jgi:hypothetical protein